jgi:type I restriction enzyme S subunit
VSARVVRLGDVAAQITDIAQPDPEDPRPYVALEHLAQGEARLLGSARAGDARSAKATFAARDILLGKLRPNLRKAALAPFDGVCSTDILVLRAGDAVRPAFLLAAVHAEAFWSFATASAVGTRMPRTSWSALAAYRFALPALDAQDRAVAALAAVDRAVEENEAHLAQLRVARRALRERLLRG